MSKQKATLGDTLRTIREEMDASPERLGAVIGVSGNSIRNYEKGRKPGPLASVAIAAFLKGIEGGDDAK